MHSSSTVFMKSRFCTCYNKLDAISTVLLINGVGTNRWSLVRMSLLNVKHWIAQLFAVRKKIYGTYSRGFWWLLVLMSQDAPLKQNSDDYTHMRIYNPFVIISFRLNACTRSPNLVFSSSFNSASSYSCFCFLKERFRALYFFFYSIISFFFYFSITEYFFWILSANFNISLCSSSFPINIIFYFT